MPIRSNTKASSQTDARSLYMPRYYQHRIYSIVRMYVCDVCVMCICMYVCMHVCVCLYVCVYVCVCVLFGAD